jgi:predicted nucleotidyltransferase
MRSVQERQARVSARAEKVRREIERFRTVLSGRPDVERAIVFGSAARGTVGPQSDVDLIVVQRTDRRFMDRLDEMYRLLAPEVACDILVYTPGEFERMRAESRFVRRAVTEGVCIHAA